MTGEQGTDLNKLDRKSASTLLRLGLPRQRRPVDALIERLTAEHGSTWLMAALEVGPLQGLGPPGPLLVEGKASLEQLMTIKERSKSLAAEASSPEERLSGLAGYYLSIAAGLRHHHRQIGGGDRTDLNEALLDVAEVSPEPIRTLLCEATLAE